MKWASIGALLFGIAAHLVIIVVGANRIYTPFSGGGDTREYVELAQNILASDGYTFAHEPTAFRAPLYPLLLALLMRVFPVYWPLCVRLLQFVASIAMALICAELADRWFGRVYKLPCAALVLLFPTTLFFSGEILTECLAALLVTAFLLAFDTMLRTGTLSSSVVAGILAGIAALERFNMLPLILFGAVALFLVDGLRTTQWQRSAILVIVAGGVLTPWLMYNEIAFHGKASYSTHGGFAAVEGVLMPLGRTQPGETEAIENALGWGNWDVETNTPIRPELRNEAILNRQAWHVAANLWWQSRWQIIPLCIDKFSAFWFSTDQIFGTQTLSWRARAIRFAGVIIYWFALIFAVLAWMKLRNKDRGIAASLVLYAALITAFHLPLTMNTRLRVPLLDPLLATLAVGSICPKSGSDKADYQSRESHMSCS